MAVRVVALLLILLSTAVVSVVECFVGVGGGGVEPMKSLVHKASSPLASTAASTSSSSSTNTDDLADGDAVRVIIFDIYGTLADSWNLGYQATKTVLTEYHNNKNKSEQSIQHTPETYPLTSEEYHFGCRYTTPERLARHVGLNLVQMISCTIYSKDMYSKQAVTYHSPILPYNDSSYCIHQDY